MVNQYQNDIVSMVGDLLGYNLSWPVHTQKLEMLTQCWFNVGQRNANVKSKMGNRLFIVYMTFLRPQQFTFCSIFIRRSKYIENKKHEKMNLGSQ